MLHMCTSTEVGTRKGPRDHCVSHPILPTRIHFSSLPHYAPPTERRDQTPPQAWQSMPCPLGGWPEYGRHSRYMFNSGSGEASFLRASSQEASHFLGSVAFSVLSSSPPEAA